ncbi:hypothetical protein CONPUDRAFT_169909 [Coniophora puteana RWD-64-598 SS2]|uniref:Uncharacterized protein n=1 Tax=Coniophora puteana (strain RWD-64-598) TaxID=741705 RepID=R7SFK5_CONPW|nr:uncharacterized protein CONPUDRAFT_169909 [Coniophora puteana RWD-64-598 SS2]EIW74522.1 hypothetical protein CONPUDRAFT_169909 [Coniophora puteana RWD-64-598 SS2]
MTERMTTRAANSKKHPGELHKALDRKTSEEIALAKQQKAAEKEKRLAEKNRTIRRLAEVENKVAEEYNLKASNATKAPTKVKRLTLRKPTEGEDTTSKTTKTKSTSNAGQDATTKRPSRGKGALKAPADWVGHVGDILTSSVVDGESVAAVKKSVADRAVIRNEVNKQRLESVSMADSAKGKNDDSAPAFEPVSFKLNIKKWSSGVQPHGPTNSTSTSATSSRIQSALTSAKSSTLAGSTIRVKNGQEPASVKSAPVKPTPVEPAPVDEPGEAGLEDDNEDDLRRERESFDERPAGAACVDEIVVVSSPPASPRPLSPLAVPAKRTSVKRRLDDSDSEDSASSVSSTSEIMVIDKEDEVIVDEYDHLWDSYSLPLEQRPWEPLTFDEEDIAQPEPDIVEARRTTAKTDVEIHSPKPVKKELQLESRPAKRVKIEEVEPSANTQEQKEKKKRKNKAPRQKDLLPSYCNSDNKWARLFVSTFLKWLGTQKSVWGPTNAKVLDAIRHIWRAVYGEELPAEQDSFSSAAFAICKQRANEWRSSFGSTAVAALVASFVEQGMYGNHDSAQQRVTYANGLLAGNAFMYEDVINGKPTHTYHGKLFLITLATHYCAIRTAIEVPELRLSTPYAPKGAMTLCCSAAERACQLAARDKLGDISDILITLAKHHESGRSGSLVNKAKNLLASSGSRKQVNSRTGKKSTTLSNFSEANCKVSTDMFGISVRNTRPVTILSDAFNASIPYAPKSKEEEDDDDDEDDEDDEDGNTSDNDDPRACLVMN